MNKKDMQKIFDRSVNSVLEQGAKSILNSHCVYRLDNLKCAVGHCMSDEAMDANNVIVDSGITTRVLQAVKKTMGITTHSGNDEDISKFLRLLQLVHDNCFETDNYTFTNRFLYRATMLAEMSKLSMDNIEYELTPPTGKHAK